VGSELLVAGLLLRVQRIRDYAGLHNGAVEELWGAIFGSAGERVGAFLFAQLDRLSALVCSRAGTGFGGEGGRLRVLHGWGGSLWNYRIYFSSIYYSYIINLCLFDSDIIGDLRCYEC
jgi:hypothetical protein